MLKKLIFLLSVVVISACVPKTIMTKPNLTQSQWQRDLAQCKYESASATQNVDDNYKSLLGQSLDQAMRRNDLIELCLKARGYTEQPQ